MSIGVAALLIAVAAPTSLAAAGNQPPFLRVAHQDSNGITLAVRIPLSAVDVRVESDGRRRLRVGPLPTLLAPGQPELPVLVASIGVPDGAEVRLSYVAPGETAINQVRSPK